MPKRKCHKLARCFFLLWISCRTFHHLLCCNQANQHETLQMYIELDVPPDGCELTNSIDDYLNTSSLVGMVCEDQCKRFVQKEKSSILTSTAETEFILVILSRVTQAMDGFHLNTNRTIATQDVYIR